MSSTEKAGSPRNRPDNGTAPLRANLLEGLRVVELGSLVSAPYCGKLLADLGADVIKVEPLEGDDARRHGPFPGGVPDPEKSGLFLYLNTNKCGVTLDVAGSEGRAELLRLLQNADIFVHNLLPAEAESLGLDYPTLQPQLPSLVVAHITPYGLSGPYRDWKGYGINTAAMGGISMGIGSPNREPLSLPLNQSGYQAGVLAACGSLTALFARDVSGRGQLVDMAEAEAWATMHTGTGVVAWVFSSRLRTRGGHRLLGLAYPHTVMPCKDGYVELVCSERRHWFRFVEMIGHPEWVDNPRYHNRLANNEQYGDELDALLAPWFMDRTREEIFALCRQYGVAGGPVRTVDELPADEQLVAREYFHEVPHPVAGTLRYPGMPYRFSNAAGKPFGGAPRLGEHNDLFLVKPSTGTTSSTVQRPSMPSLPLQGLRVLDFGWIWAGALPGHMLADFGAEVIKVESRKYLDFMRAGRPIIGDKPDPEQNHMFHNVNRNKLSMTVDITNPRGQELLKNLARICDVAVENFVPGFLARNNLSYEHLRAVKPDIIMISMSGVGQRGPLAEMRSYAAIIAGMSGMDSLVGYYGERILGMQQAYGDPAASIHGFFAVLAALRHRRATGEGQYIDLSQLEALTGLTAEAILEYQMTGRVPEPMGNRSPDYAPHGHYPCEGKDKWVSIACANDREFQALVAEMARPDLAVDPRFREADRRWDNQVELDQIIAEWTRPQPAQQVAERLQAVGVAAAPLLDHEGRYLDPHFQERQTYVDVEHPVLGTEPIYNVPWRLSETPGSVHRRAPLLGEHNEYVLRELLKLSPAQIEELVQEKVIQ